MLTEKCNCIFLSVSLFSYICITYASEHIVMDTPQSINSVTNKLHYKTLRQQLWKMTDEYHARYLGWLVGSNKNRPDGNMYSTAMLEISKKQPDVLVDVFCQHASEPATKEVVGKALLNCKGTASNAILNRLENWDDFPHQEGRKEQLIKMLTKSPRSRKFLLSLFEPIVREMSPPRPPTAKERDEARQKGLLEAISIQETLREIPFSEYIKSNPSGQIPDNAEIVYKECIEVRLVAAEKLISFYGKDDDVLKVLIMSLDTNRKDYSGPLDVMLWPILKNRKDFVYSVVSNARIIRYVSIPSDGGIDFLMRNIEDLFVPVDGTLPPLSPDSSNKKILSVSSGPKYESLDKALEQYEFLKYLENDDEDCVLSANSKLVAFFRKKRIHIMKQDGTLVRYLETGNPEWDTEPDWSPDDSQIVFESWVETRNKEGHLEWNDEIFIINADGTSPKRLTHSIADEQSPKWSPNNDMILFHSAKSGEPAIYTMTPTGRNIRKIVEGGLASWSRDGRWIIFYYQGKIFKIDPNGRNRKEIAKGLYPYCIKYTDLIMYYNFGDKVFSTNIEGDVCEQVTDDAKRIYHEILRH